MKPLIIHTAAEAEVESAAVHYPNAQVLVESFGRLWKGRSTEFAGCPRYYPPIDKQGIRKMRLERFPYTIYYVALDDFHGSPLWPIRDGGPDTGRAAIRKADP